MGVVRAMSASIPEPMLAGTSPSLVSRPSLTGAVWHTRLQVSISAWGLIGCGF
jgi:hypothetical protein